MSTYKVPQNVEAEDKLLGPLTFKQFIFMLLAGAAGLMGWLLYQIQPLLSVLTLPFILVFGGLAVFRREDQPVERYLLSFFNFTLRPRTRIWNTEGKYEHLIITAPKTKAVIPLKQNLSEVHGQLERLAQVVDTRGWSARRPDLIVPGSPGDDRLFMPDPPAIEVPDEDDDILDPNNPEVIALEKRIVAADEENRRQILSRVQEASKQPTPIATKPAPASAAVVDESPSTTNIAQPKPEDVKAQAQPVYSDPAHSAIVEELARENELTISQIQAQAKRRNDQLTQGQEISLR